MQEKYDLYDVDNSFTKFDDLVSDLMNSDYSTFDSNLRAFLNHCENDEIMSIVCNQLECDNTVLERWWSGNDLNTAVSHVGSRKLNPPIDDKQKDALYYQICLKMSKEEDEVFGFCINYTNCSPDGAIFYFNKNIVYPLVRSMKRKLNEIKSKGTIQQGDKRYILVQNFYVYQNFSTTINGDVNTKGDVAIGEGASIEKKSSLI